MMRELDFIGGGTGPYCEGWGGIEKDLGYIDGRPIDLGGHTN